MRPHPNSLPKKGSLQPARPADSPLMRVNLVDQSAVTGTILTQEAVAISVKLVRSRRVRLSRTCGLGL